MTEAELIEKVQWVITNQTETQTLEVKGGGKGVPKVKDTLSSFSNQDEGGIILFGIEETHGRFEATGVYDAHDLQARLSEQCKEMEPEVRPLITITTIDGKSFVSMEVPGLDVSLRPCFYKGAGILKGSYVRVGQSDEPMTDYEVYSYQAFKQRLQDDIEPVPQAKPSHIDQDAVLKFIAQAREGKANFATFDEKQVLSLTNVLVEDKYSLSACLLFGIYPQTFFPQLCIMATVVPGKKMGDTNEQNERFIDNKRIEGNLKQMLDAAVSFVQKNMRQRVGFDQKSAQRVDRDEYPLLAVREVLLNALTHRDYSIHTQNMYIQLTMYEDRLEVTNPGGLYGRIRLDELGHKKVATRNPQLVHMMEVMKICENRYSGIPTIQRAMADNHLPPAKFIDNRNEFKVCLYNKPITTSPTPNGKHTSEEALLAFCNIERTRAELAQFIGLDSTSYAIKKYIEPLVQQGKIVLSLPDKPNSKFQRYRNTNAPKSH